MYIIVIGINHKRAPVEVREKLAMSRLQIRDNVMELQSLDSIEGIIVLSTCNRTEYYLTSSTPSTALTSVLDFMSSYAGTSREILKKYIYHEESGPAVRHLFKVAAGLDSMILGESQILGQVEDAYNYAREYSLTNSVLNNLFQRAIYVGKRVRSETQIDRHAVSVGSAAVELARKVFGNLGGCSVLVLGAGDTSELTLKHLVANGVSTVIVANRTYDKALKLAAQFEGEAIRFADFHSYLKDADIVISCTAAPHYIVEGKEIETLEAKRKGRPLLFIDIAVPRDIHPAVGSLGYVSLYDVDDLQNVVAENLVERKKEAQQALLIITEELHKFNKWFDSLYVIPTIAALKKRAQGIMEQELEKTYRRLGNLDDREKKLVRSLAYSITNKLLNGPICNIKEYAHTDKGWLYAEAIEKLFDLDEGNQELKGEGIG